MIEYERPDPAVRGGLHPIAFYMAGKRGEVSVQGLASVEMLALEYSKWNAMIHGWPRHQLVQTKGTDVQEPACCHCLARPSHPASFFCSAACADTWANAWAAQLGEYGLGDYCAVHRCGFEPGEACSGCADGTPPAGCTACRSDLPPDEPLFCTRRCASGWADRIAVWLLGKGYLAYCDDHHGWSSFAENWCSCPAPAREGSTDVRRLHSPKS